MSNKNKGMSRGRPRKPITSDEDADDMEINQDEPEKKQRAPRQRPPDVSVLLRKMDIAQSKIGVLIDSLEGDENETTLKRNVVIAVKHLKEIHGLLEH